MKEIKLLVIPIASPNVVGIYEDDILVDKIFSDEKTSDFLVKILDELGKKYKISLIVYSNGPGSFMGIKVAYVILSTFCLVKNIKLQSVCGFELSNNLPIKANKSLSFIKENGKITLKKVEPSTLNLPKDLSKLNLSDDILPNYIIDAV